MAGNVALAGAPKSSNVAGNVALAAKANLAGYSTCVNVACNRQVMWWTITSYNANVAGNVLE